MGDHDYLPSITGLAEKSNQFGVHGLGIEVFLRLINDERHCLLSIDR